MKNKNLLRNESIKSIAILGRADSPSYRQWFSTKWIDLHFGGELPVIMTGLITNLMKIKLKLLVDDETIYIDFAYQGIPEDLPLSK